MMLGNQEAVQKERHYPEILDSFNKCNGFWASQESRRLSSSFIYRDVRGLHLNFCFTFKFRGFYLLPTVSHNAYAK